MKKLLYALLAVVVLLVAAVLVLPGLIDWNAYKAQIADQVERVTGRQVEIVGNVELSMLPSPALNVERLRLANLEGGSAQSMAELGALRVRVALAPLLQGRVAVERVALIEPRILLERLADGRANWRFAGLGGGAPGGGDGLLQQVRLDSFRIVDGTLIYRDQGTGVAERITGLDAELAAESLSGPFEAAGRGTLRGIPLDFDGRLGRVDGQGGTPYDLTVALPEDAGEATLSGLLGPRGADDARLQGALRVSAPRLSTALARLTGRPAARLPAQTANPFRLESDLVYTGRALRGEALTLSLGETSADGNLQVAFGPQPEARLALTAQRVSLDRLLAEAGARDADGSGAGGADTESGSAAGGARTGLGAIPLPEGLRAELDLQVGALVWREQVVRQGRLNAVLADGEITLNQAMALLPGSSDVALFGTLAEAENRTPVFDGRIEAASDNLRAVFDWLGVNVAGVPPDRLRRVNLLADVRGTPRQVTLTGIDLDVDTMEVSGGVAIALRERPGFGIGLTVDSLNLDAYLPAAGPAGSDSAAGEGPAGEGPAGEGPAGEGGAALGFLGGFDANFDLRAGRITYGGRSARRVALDATLHNQRLELRELSVADFAGTRASLAGELHGLVGLDPRFDLDLDLDVRAPRRLAQAFGLGDAVPRDLGAMALVGTLTGDPAAVDLDATATAFGGTLSAKGTVEPLAPAAPFDLVLEARHDSLADLAGRLPWLPAAAGASGRQAGGPTAGIALASQVVGDLRRFRSARLKGEVGGVALSGPFAVDLTGARPRVEAQLETGVLPAGLFALAAGGGAAGAGTAGDAGDGEGARWASQPFDLAGLRALDGALTLDADAIGLGPELRLREARLVAGLADGVLDVDRLEGTLLGGTLTLSGTLDARDRPALSLRTEARDLATRQLLSRAFGRPVLQGPVTLTAELTAQGRSERALVESLQGDGALSGEVTVQPAALLGAEAAQRLQGNDGARQLDRLLGEAFGQQVRIQGVSQVLDFVGRSFADAPATLAGTFTVADGRLRSDDLRLENESGRARVDGRIDLPNWRIDARTRLYRPQDGSERPFVVARQAGPLDAPDVSITGGAFPAAATDGAEPDPAADGTAPDGGAPEDQDGDRHGDRSGDRSGDGGADAAGAGDAPEPAPTKPRDAQAAPDPTAEDGTPAASEPEAAPGSQADAPATDASGADSPDAEETSEADTGEADSGEADSGDGAGETGEAESGGSRVDDIIRGILEEGAQ